MSNDSVGGIYRLPNSPANKIPIADGVIFELLMNSTPSSSLATDSTSKKPPQGAFLQSEKLPLDTTQTHSVMSQKFGWVFVLLMAANHLKCHCAVTVPPRHRPVLNSSAGPSVQPPS